MATEERCPRCQAVFTCAASSIAACPCRNVELTDEQRMRLAARFQGCLCPVCLRELAGELSTA